MFHIEYIFLKVKERKNYQSYLGNYINEDIKIYKLSDNLFKDLFLQKTTRYTSSGKMNTLDIGFKGSFYLLM